ncbi:hypothetical protein TKK_0000494 [Trichogramma kaykai]
MTSKRLTDGINSKKNDTGPDNLPCIDEQDIEKLVVKLYHPLLIFMKASLLWPYLSSAVKYRVGFFQICMDTMLLASTVKEIIESMMRNWSKSNSDESKFLKKYIDLSLFICYTAGVLMCASYISYITVPVLWPLFGNAIIPGNHTYEKKLSLHLELFIDEDRYFYFYFIITLLICFSLFISMSATAAYYITSTFYAIGRFKYISIKLQKISEFSKKKIKFNTKDHVSIYNYICQLVGHHQYCIHLVDIINYMSSDIFLAALSCGIFAGTFAGTLIVIEYKKQLNVAIVMVFIYVMFIEFLIVFSCISQKVYDTSDEVYNECYFTEWYKFSPQNRRMIQIIMIRASRPSCMTIGPNLVFHLETSGDIIRLSLSYITALMSIVQLES